MADKSETFILSRKSGFRLSCISLGATITELQLPCGADVVLGYQNIEDYQTCASYIGCTVGRVANRIRDAKFVLDGHTYQLTSNIAPHHLHGGKTGFDKFMWEVQSMDSNSITFTHTSKSGSEGYPGNLTASMTYTLTEDNEVHIDHSATTDAPTIVNLTNHSYFNLAGKGTIHDHVLMLTADTYTPTVDMIATGSLEPVAGTALDFLTPRTLGERMEEVGGYDHNFNLLGVKQTHPRIPSLKLCATLEDPGSGRKLSVYTDQPGVQLYTGNFLDGSKVGKGGVPIIKHGGVCLETQAWPNAINIPSARDHVILRPGQTYRHKTVWAFSCPQQ